MRVRPARTERAGRTGLGAGGSAPASAEVGERLRGGPGLGSCVAVDAAGVVADVDEEALEAADGVGAGVAVHGSGVESAVVEEGLPGLPALGAELAVDRAGVELPDG